MTNPLQPMPIEHAMIRGAVEIEATARGLVPHRLPRWARRQIPDRFMIQTSAESAGVRLTLRTAADVIELDVQARRIAADADSPLPPSTYVASGKLSLQVVRAATASIVDRRRNDGDHRLRYLDGLSLYGESDAAAMPLPDNLHPGPDVQRLIGERFADRLLADFAVS